MVSKICMSKDEPGESYLAADPPQRIIIRPGQLPDNVVDRGGDGMTFEGPFVRMGPFGNSAV
jgi:hypothetical protein